MKEGILKTVTAKTTEDGNHMESLNDHGKEIAQVQLAWLLLLANNVVGHLKVSTATSAGVNRDRILAAKRKRGHSC